MNDSKETARVWVVACILTKQDYGTITISQTLSWKRNCTEEEAKGHAIEFALKEKTGFAISHVMAAKVDP